MFASECFFKETTMPRTHHLCAALLCAAVAACSTESRDVTDPGTPSLRAASAPGQYDLTLFLNAGGELILGAHVADLATGAPAQQGSVMFQECVRKGGH